MSIKKAKSSAQANGGVPETAPTSSAPSKLSTLIALLTRPEGVDLKTMQAATGWQAHSVRGVLSGAIKKKLGYEVASEKAGADRVWRITKGAGA